MSSELKEKAPVPEFHEDSFHVKFKDSDLVYNLLTQNSNAQVIDVENNWREISDKKYDLFKGIIIFVSSQGFQSFSGSLFFFP